MDIVIKDKATWMIAFHLVLMTIASIAGMIGWIWSVLIVPLKKPVCVSTSAGDSGKSKKPQPRANSYDTTNSKEDTMWAVIKRVYSPFLMCMCGWPQKNFYSPGIIPYALVDRSLCHPINIILMFFSFCVTFTVYFVKKYSPSISRPWGRPPKGCHLVWLFMLPMLCCMPIVYVAMHYPLGILHRALRNNRITVTILAIIVNGSTTVLDNMGYIGVSACSKDSKGNRGPNAMRVIAMTSFTAQFITSFTYRMSTGYLLVWRKYVDDICNTAPTEDMDWFSRFIFWATTSNIYAGYDFVNEFKGNIKDVVAHDVEID
ncbi:uncharacterized protein BXIN_1304 [Babesia sp. Xinjiang]|uniref:uncharacterized protein n=1 Tax=Babesia sp. Xinjiang TaxID=462227 RepID=UPI000A23AE20|nr:uncharacterized protein BXIN_1304 [Babesia sp. Xinjiang]ORM40158.1 hypothetical protein BXIN_1304 [Babesia sp. Xinjiang]